jgi:Transcriptional regulator LmrA/YxaF-like, C-terminal domain
VAASLASEVSPATREAAAAAFRHWEELIASALAPHVGSTERARSLATIVIASIEGAIVLSRASRTTAPLERVATELEQLLTDAIRR